MLRLHGFRGWLARGAAFLVTAGLELPHLLPVSHRSCSGTARPEMGVAEHPSGHWPLHAFWQGQLGAG